MDVWGADFDRVKTTARPKSRPARSRFGYDRFWQGTTAAVDPQPAESYWAGARLPIPSLLFITPLMLGYEVGVRVLGGAAADSLRTGADSWMRSVLASVGLMDRWLPPLAVLGALLGWQALRSKSWRFRPRWLLGMAVESLLFALVLVGLSRIVELGFNRLEGGALLDAASRAKAAAIVGYLGAGVYEEALFRLGLIPLIYYLARFVHAPQVLAGTLAVTGSALLFSLAHHAGAPGEAFTLYAFVFRWLAGVFFAWIFLVRGFGVAVGAHAAYDVLVGWVGMHF